MAVFSSTGNITSPTLAVSSFFYPVQNSALKKQELTDVMVEHSVLSLSARILQMLQK